MRPLKNLCEVAVIGGGLAGLSAACHVARLGRLVTLFEGTGLYGGLVAKLHGDGHIPGAYSMPFTSVVAGSGGYSFEIDNIAYAGSAGTSGAPVPEPWSVGLLAFGLLGIGYTAARRSARTI